MKFMLLIKHDYTNNICVIFLIVTAGEQHQRREIKSGRHLEQEPIVKIC